jgi:hypothetical protein
MVKWPWTKTKKKLARMKFHLELLPGARSKLEWLMEPSRGLTLALEATLNDDLDKKLIDLVYDLTIPNDPSLWLPQTTSEQVSKRLLQWTFERVFHYWQPEISTNYFRGIQQTMSEEFDIAHESNVSHQRLDESDKEDNDNKE